MTKEPPEYHAGDFILQGQNLGKVVTVPDGCPMPFGWGCGWAGYAGIAAELHCKRCMVGYGQVHSDKSGVVASVV